MATIYKKNDKFGLVSNNGHPLTDADFDQLEPFEMESSGYYIGYVSTHPYLIKSDDGAIFDIFQFDEECTLKEVMERVLNWTMPGLQLFYRDTDMPLDSEKMYRVGEVLRAGFFIDVSPYAGNRCTNIVTSSLRLMQPVWWRKEIVIRCTYFMPIPT